MDKYLPDYYVFDIEKYVNSMIRANETKKEIQQHLNAWASNCEGLTHKQMRTQRNCGTDIKWMKNTRIEKLEEMLK